MATSEDDFLAQVIEALFSEGDASADSSDASVSSDDMYTITNVTSSTVTIETTEREVEGKTIDEYVVERYTAPWDTIKYDTPDTIESFVSRVTIEPTVASSASATLEIPYLLADHTYYIVVTPSQLKEQAIVGGKDSVEMEVTTSPISSTRSEGYAYIEKVLFDRDTYSIYVDGGENTALFLGLFLKKIQKKSVTSQEATIDAMYKHIQSFGELSVLAMGLNFDGVISILRDAGASNIPVATTSPKKDATSSQPTYTLNGAIDVTRQIFPAKESGKKIVVFRTNMTEMKVQRATWHFGVSDIQGCERQQCDRVMYELDAGKNHAINVSYATFENGETKEYDEVLAISL